MGIFPLPIFPEGALASSVITTVWVGVFVLCFFNLRFGWVLSGLVVPGYLVPLLIVKPLAAAVILVEAIQTYLLVWLFSEKLSRGRYPSLFGRDRFMGLILASILVRLIMDGLVLPEVAGWLEQNFDRRFDWQDNLQSFGLVIISLLANQFWKPGLGRGLGAAFVTIGLTFVIVRYGLMEMTNFRMSGVSYLYEGLASSILASPKAYIILTLTAMFASHMNVRYGWDFSGILIPALIALQWYQPTKIVTSFAEAIVIYCVARLILKLPIMANVTIEGARKLLLFFNISFAWKMALGWFVVWQGLEVKTTDFYGFGYLLSTLIAIKAHDKDIFPRLARSTLQVSLMGAVLGNIVGFSLSAAVTQGMAFLSGVPVSARPDNSSKVERLVVAAVGDAHVRKVRGEARPLSAEAARMLGDMVELSEAGLPATAPVFDLGADGWRVQRLEDGLLAIVRNDGGGRELLLFDPHAPRDLAIVLPDPTAAPGLAAAALALRRIERARWLVIAAPQPLAAMPEIDVVQIFARASRSTQLFLGAAPGDEPARIDLANRSGSAADVSRLREAIEGLEVGLESGTDVQGANRATLLLDRTGLAALARLSAPVSAGANGRACRLPRVGEPAPGRRALNDLAYLRFEVAAPLIAGLGEGGEPDVARAAARLAGFEIETCMLGGRPHWNLFAPRRAEGHYLFVTGTTQGRAVIGYRVDSRLAPARIAAGIHARWRGGALLIAPHIEDFSRSPRSSFDVVWQEWVRARSAGDDPPSVLQLRSRPDGIRSIPRNADIVLASERIGQGNVEPAGLVSAIRAAGLRPQMATTDRRFAGYEARPSTTSRYLAQAGQAHYTVGWLMIGQAGEAEP